MAVVRKVFPAVPAVAAESVRRRGIAIMLFSAVAFSTAGLFAKGVGADAWGVIFWRGTFAVAFMVAYTVYRGSFAREFLRMGWPGIAVTFASTVGMMAFITAFKLTTVANVSLIYATGPFLSAALAWMWFRERPAIAVALASLAAVGGVAVIVSGSLGGVNLKGDLLALVMTSMLSIMMVVYRRYPETPAIGPTATSAALALPFCLAFGDPLVVSNGEILILAAFALVFTVAAVTMLEGARRLSPPEASLISALEVPLAPIWAWLILSESPAVPTLVGGAIILAAVFGSQAWQLSRARVSAAGVDQTVSAATPGRVLPSSHSRNAPPAVDT